MNNKVLKWQLDFKHPKAKVHCEDKIKQISEFTMSIIKSLDIDYFLPNKIYRILRRIKIIFNMTLFTYEGAK